MIKSFFFFLLSVCSASICAQEAKLLKNFGVDNPISYQFVTTIAQDKHGFMWFGAQEGVHRFDGHQLVSFHHDSAKQSSLSSNVISRIIIDQKQRLWVGTRGGGVNLYREATQDFFHLTSNTPNAELSNDSINTLFEDSNGNLWIGTENGLNILSTQEEKWSVKQIFQQLSNPKSLSHNIIHSIIETQDNKIWVGTNGGGVSVFDLAGNFIKTIKYGDSNSATYVNKFVNSLYNDAQGNIWIGTVDSGLLKYVPSTDTFIHFQFEAKNPSSISSNSINKIYQDSDNIVWVATDNGLSIYDEVNNNFVRYNHSPNNPYSLSNDYVLTFFEDKHKMMWVGTFTGVNRWDPAMTTFSQYTGKNYPALKSPNITSFTQTTHDKVIFSTYSGGIYQLKLSEDKVSKLDFNDYFSELRIMTLFYDNEFLWVGTRASGLFKVNLSTKNITSFKHNESDTKSLSANSVTDIIKDKYGQLWVSTFYQGLNRFNADGSFTRYISNKNSPERGPSNNYILHLLEDEQGYIWLATYGGGLNRFDPQAETFTHIFNDKNNPDSLSSDLAWFMLLDKDKDLWVGTQAAGLNVLSYQNRVSNNFVFKHFDTKDGMKSHTVYGMVQDSYDDIWLSSNQGVSRYSPQSKSFKHFDLSHGLVDLDYNHGAIFKGLDNTIYFGAGKGFSNVKPDTSQNSLLAPEIRLTDIFKLNEPVKFDTALADITLLELDHTDQLVSFEFVGLNYANPDSTRYQYRLLGFDQSWIDAGKSRRVSYTNLPSGKYQLQVIAGNNDNVWSDPALSLQIIVKPAPWNTWWAYLLYAMIIALILLSYSRFLNRKLIIEQEQKALLSQQVEDQTKEFQLKNIELEHANKQLENAATVDKLTGVKSRRYLDIYIEQASQLMSQIHQNILPTQRNILPRLYIIMVRVDEAAKVSNSQLLNLTDLLLYSRNKDDLVIRWSEDVFAIIGYEKEDNARELSLRLANRFAHAFGDDTQVNMAYSFYPFNVEQPTDLSWDQVSVITENALNIVSKDDSLQWLGLYHSFVQPFNYMDILHVKTLDGLSQVLSTKQG